ncbi:hypothetical protein SEA_MAZUN_23 [Microbacterium phage Mazun]|nr:hypothetical protein SEA_MAZUN_23 [Microbacterium phage Mazun]
MTSIGMLVNNMPTAHNEIKKLSPEVKARLAELGALSIDNQRKRIRELEQQLDNTIRVQCWLTHLNRE